MSGMSEKTIKFREKEIFYRVYGQGSAVVLLHGFAETSTIWAAQVDFLKNHFRLIVPDIPGTGRSALVPGANIDTYATIIKLLLDQELAPVGDGKKEKVTMVGHSMGGYITLSFAEQFQDYLHSLCLFHSSAFADDEDKKEIRKKAIRFINENGVYEFLKTSIPGLFTSKYVEANAGKIRALVEQGRAFTPEALVQYYEAMIARPDRTAVLRSFPGTIMFIIGEHDTAVPLTASLKQCHLPLRPQIHLLQQSAHMGMLEETTKANELLLSFLQ